MNFLIRVTPILFLLFPGYCLAQSVDATEAEAPPFYDVEIVIFKNSRAPKSREFILPVSSPGKDENVLELSSASSVEKAMQQGYELLPSTEFRLLEVVTRLVESSRYELLMHVAWRQPGVEEKDALPVWINGGRIFGNEYTSIDSQIEVLEKVTAPDMDSDVTTYEFDEQTLESLELQMMERENDKPQQNLYELEGKITVALSRYLHLHTDLVLRRPRLSVDPVLNSSAQDRLLASYAADTRILNNHSLREHRRMRSKTLHYLDNPEFSLLAIITPVEALDPTEEIAEEPESAAVDAE